jgi:two-component system response regulator HydG
MGAPRRHVLVVDDEDASREALCELLLSEGYAPSTARDGAEALDRLQSSPFPLLISELETQRLGVLDLLHAIEHRHLPTALVVLTRHASIESAVAAIRHGAHDYLTKPVDPQQLLQVVPRAFEAFARTGHQRSRPSTRVKDPTSRIIGDSSAMHEVFSLIRMVAPTDANVLILGETGTGKELVASAIHELSPRADHRYVSLNSAALPQDILESELFGHEKGAFTGAVARKEGCFELADGGTLFLDEVGEMAPATQAKLLRALEGHSYRRLGGSQEIQTTVRVIAATNRDVSHMIQGGPVRQDLYFRLSTVVIKLPALRERREDIPLLARAFLQEFSARNGKTLEDVSPQAMQLLVNYPWPGNVRELRNAMEHAAIVAHGGPTLQPTDLPISIRTPWRPVEKVATVSLCTIDEMERRLIEEAVERFPTRTQAAAALGISLRTLYNKLQRYSLEAGPDPNGAGLSNGKALASEPPAIVPSPAEAALSRGYYEDLRASA